MIQVVKEEASTITFNQAYDKFQVNQEKAQIIQLLYLERRKVHEKNQWNIIMIIYTAIQNIPAKV